jgi:hypothetical protein
VKGTEVALILKEKEEYISLTDIAKYRDNENPSQIISLWLRTYSTIEYLGLWETLNNLNFNPHIYEGVKKESAKPHFWMSPQKWINETNAIGMVSKSGRYGGGTFAHSDIAFKFAAWISAEFELYLVTKEQASFIYANEADLLNVALFGMTAKEWREANPKEKGNIRDLATLEQLVVLSNMESINALLIRQGFTQSERLQQLNSTAITQMKSLLGNQNLMKQLK